MKRAALPLLLALLAGTARADDALPIPAPRRPWHGSLGAGGSLLATGARGDGTRFDLAADLKPRSRFGALVAWRAFDGDHRGLLTGGVVYEAGAARPRLVLDLHADAGIDLDNVRPLVGGGLRTTITVIAPLAVQLDTGALLVVDGVEGTRLQIYTSALLGARF
ncbi:MAG: hypothetical protein KIT31_34560 [Deltaproteobacteria bacterium]|nr:hypothetical protein [Deltaproteobacteria bacterium]